MKKQLLLVCAIALCTITMNAQFKWTSESDTGFNTVGNWTIDGEDDPTDRVPDENEAARFSGSWSTVDCDITGDVHVDAWKIGRAHV